ncbi:MAG: FadR/GntR family transcriptional regulator [Oscillospiraceae bacterium]
MILSGRLAIGERLPPERQLAESMQVSRAVVNGGIAELARNGFLTIRPRVGIFVADYRKNGNVETLLSIMKYNGGHLRSDEVRSILQIKLVLDRLAVQLSVPKLARQELETLQKALQELAAAQSVELAAATAFAFYHELALLSGNTLLPLIYHSFKVPVLSLWERYGRKYGLQTVYEGAARLYAAIEARNVEAAVVCVERTVGEAIEGSKGIYTD